MSSAARVSEDRAREAIVLEGDWTAISTGGGGRRLNEALARSRTFQVDATGIDRCDTAGAAIISAALRRVDRRPDDIAATDAVSALIDLVRRREAPTEAPPKPLGWTYIFERMGRAVYSLRETFVDMIVFNGHLIVSTARTVRHPSRMRWAAFFSLAERAGLDAIPIVSVATFFIGAVVAMLGANQLAHFGAQIFVIDLVGISVLREFNVLITTLLLAGRSASSFAAEIGAMKMNEEVDAMEVLGIDPFDALVTPRFLALLVTIPLLTFVATIAGLAGGMLVAVTMLGLTPDVFFDRLVSEVGVHHFWVGLSKAPVMAVIIAAIGCRQGLAVGGDVESLGRRVTAAVVEAIFSAIVIDAIFALIYMRADY
jgi:phospholipid/cholesterol/gamma-HCH transport system permease protein